MRDDELRRVFATVLTAPPPDTADIDVTIRAGRRRQRHRRAAAVLLSAAAVIAVAGLVLLPIARQRPAPPAVSPAVTVSPTVTVSPAVTVTDARELLGRWRTTELDGKDVRGSEKPLNVVFEQRGGELWWGANDLLNYHSGKFSVSRQGRFQAEPGMMTDVGSIGGIPLYERNPEAVQQATEARLVAATPAGPRKLLLLAQGQVIAVYVGQV